ncbi:hypothetical protein [Kamptonema formosum]|nr:hypothetical protein [Oscillatoria sp. PCC 10802]
MSVTALTGYAIWPLGEGWGPIAGPAAGGTPPAGSAFRRQLAGLV